MGTAHFPKPKDMPRKRKPPYKTFPDGREVIDLTTIAGRALRDSRLEEAWTRDGQICGICKWPISLFLAVPDHIKPRKMGGSERDDRVENLQAAHYGCNMAKGSRRL